MTGAAPRGPVAILAVDGGNSKTELALIGRDGAVLGVARAGSGSYHAVGMRRMIETFRIAVRAAAVEGGLDPAAVDPEVGVYCLAGADLPVDDRRLARALGRSGLARSTVVRNDAFTGLRAGTTHGWGIAMVCGAGMNCAGIGPTGRTVRFPSLGAFSGDEGGGGDLAIRAVAAAIHSRDGRGPRTALERLVPGHFGLRHPLEVVEAVHVGRLPEERLLELAPVVFAEAQGGDAVARSLADWLADQTVLQAASAIRRLALTRRPVEIVFVGSIWKTDDQGFHDRVRAGLLAVAPRAVLRRLDAPPVLGAALLGIDRLGLGAAAGAAEARLRSELTVARLGRVAAGGRS